MSILLGWHVVDVDGCVLLELEPVAAAAPLVLAGDQPHPLDGRVTLLARAADHSVLRGEAAGSHSISVVENVFSILMYRASHLLVQSFPSHHS